MDLIEKFKELPAGTDQNEIQESLTRIHNAHDLQTVMNCLFDWELKAGYITKEKLENVERLSFNDVSLKLDFRIQINYARSKYCKKIQADPGLPPVKCAICKENIGRQGKEYLRVYEFPLGREKRSFFLQLTPFPLYAYHFVLILSDHKPQKINRQSVDDMFDFLESAPDYTVCSNSDVEWAGSSILEHLHFQIFKHLKLPVMQAQPRKDFRRIINRCTVDWLNYPLAAISVRGESRKAVTETGSTIIGIWKQADPGRNTVNLVLIREGMNFELTILLRNPDHRTPEHLKRIKSEGVGVIEAAGEGIFPVPSGEYSEEIWTQIRGSGLDVMKGILAGNNPVNDPVPIERLFHSLEGGYTQ